MPIHTPVCATLLPSAPSPPPFVMRPTGPLVAGGRGGRIAVLTGLPPASRSLDRPVRPRPTRSVHTPRSDGGRRSCGTEAGTTGTRGGGLPPTDEPLPWVPAP